MNLAIIVAMAKNRVIGRNDDLPWHLPDDLNRFKQLTVGHPVIMGRKTFESIMERLGKPLPGRLNIVISRTLESMPFGSCVVRSFEEALELVKETREAFVIGGYQVYREALPVANMIHMTYIDQEFEGDTTFPSFNPNQWEVIDRQPQAASTEGIPFEFLTYKRKAGEESC